MSLRFLFILIFVLADDLAAANPNKDDEELRKLNLEIAAAEDRGDRAWLGQVLANEPAFRRANGKIVGRVEFLESVRPREASKTEIESISMFGKDRALVSCKVTLLINNQTKAFHNLRLFVRASSGWILLGWANEAI